MPQYGLLMREVSSTPGTSCVKMLNAIWLSEMLSFVCIQRNSCYQPLVGVEYEPTKYYSDGHMTIHLLTSKW